MSNTIFDIDYQIANTSFGQLFHAVQFSNIFSDSKTFTDCTAKRSIEAILIDYLLEKNTNEFNLKEFILANFDLPKIPQTNFTANTSHSLDTHIGNIWPFLTIEKSDVAGTYVPLPKPFVVPGGRFQEVYYWDSYFTCLGLLEHQKHLEVEHIIENFAYLIDTYGFVPNGNRSYFLSRSQPPFFAPLLVLFSKIKGEQLLVKYLPTLLKEYSFWMADAEKLNETNLSIKRVVNVNGSILNRYWDNLDTPRPESYKEDIELVEKILAEIPNSNPKKIYRDIRAAAESGWDFSSRWFADGENMDTIETTDIIPVDLNCLIYFLEKTIAQAFLLENNDIKAAEFDRKGKNRLKAINDLFWNEDYYYDYNFQRKTLTKHKTLAACFPLFFKIADLKQAEKVGSTIEREFLQNGGLVTTLKNSGQQWDWPNGWAPLQWIGYQGFINYNLIELAQKIKTKWLNKVEEIYKKEGKLTEKYDVVNTESSGGGGEYPNQDGFGWTNGVTLTLLKSQ